MNAFTQKINCKLDSIFKFSFLDEKATEMILDSEIEKPMMEKNSLWNEML